MFTNQFRNILFVLITITASVVVAQENTKQKYSIPTKDLAGKVVAEVGPIQITVDEFINNYEFGPAFIKRIKESRKRHLDFMIYEKLLALEGYDKKLDTLDDVRLFLEDIQGDLAGEKLYRSLIWDKINISDKEISEAVEKDNIELTLKWIFTKDAEQAVTMYKQLTNGVPFDSLFVKQFRDSVVYEDRFLETTRFKLEKSNFALASIIDSIVPGKTSQPVRTNDGWYIVKVNNIRKNIIQTETDYNDQRYKLELALKKQKADSVSDVFIRGMFDSEQPVIIRTSFNAIAYYIGTKYLNPSQILEWDLKKNLDMKFVEGGKVIPFHALNDTLIKMNSEPVKLRTFLEWYSTRESYIKFILTSREGFLNSVQSIVWRMLRDYLITRTAAKENFDNETDVQREMKWWKDKAVYSKMKQIIAASISTSKDKIIKYYSDNKTDYTDGSGVVKDFNEIEADVKNDYYAYEYTKRIVNNVLSLKNKYRIKVNEELLNNIPVSEENNPRSINLYSVKKGGTFVRPVYPVIDNEWQFWN